MNGYAFTLCEERSSEGEALEKIGDSLRIKNIMELARELHSLNALDDNAYIAIIKLLMEEEGIPMSC